MATDPIKMTDEVHLEVTTPAPKKAAAKHAAAAEPAPETTVAAIAEKDWTAQDHNTIVIDRPEDWPTQDYVNKPPERVLFERPHDSI